MSNKENERLIRAASSTKEASEFKNIKFFLGSDRNITQEALSEQAANALTQLSVVMSQPKPSIDRDMPTTTIKQFVG